MHCPSCGTPLDAGAHFCGACGHRLEVSLTGSEDTLPAGSKRSDIDDMPPTVHGAPAPAPPAVAPAAIPPTARPAAAHGGARPASIPPTAQPPAQPRTPGAANRPLHPDELIGRTLNDRYQVLRKIGQGGFGAVFEGLQTRTNRHVALKVLYPHMTRDQSLVARFRREAKTSASLRDAHTVVTYDFDETPDGVLYIAMELVEGSSLQAVLVDGGAMAPARTLRIIDQMCSSLAEAHAHGIVHRDIKPENVMLEQRPGEPDYVKLLDFGIAKIMHGEGAKTAKLTAMGQTVGTLEYMSPEQLAGEPLDGRSDIYSLGVLMYQCLAGTLPFKGPPTVVIHGHIHQTPAPLSQIDPGLSGTLESLVLGCLAKEREDRPSDVMALRQALRTALAEVEQPRRTRPPTVAGKTGAQPPGVGAAAQPLAGPPPAGPPPAGPPPAGPSTPSPFGVAAPPAAGWGGAPSPLVTGPSLAVGPNMLGPQPPQALQAPPPTNIQPGAYGAGATPPPTNVQPSNAQPGAYGAAGVPVIGSPAYPQAPPAAPYAPSAPPRGKGKRGKSRGGMVMLIVGLSVLGLGALGGGLWYAFGSGSGGGDGGDGDGGLASTLRLVTPKCDMLLLAFPKRIEATQPGTMSLPLVGPLGAMLKATGAKVADFEELLVIAPNVPEMMFSAGGTAETAIALRGIDAAAVTKKIGARADVTKSNVGGTTVYTRTVYSAAAVDKRTVVFGMTKPVQAMLAQAAGATGATGDSATPNLKRVADGGQLLFYGHMALPASVGQQLQRTLDLETPPKLSALTAGITSVGAAVSGRLLLSIGDAATAKQILPLMQEQLSCRRMPQLCSVIDKITLSVDGSDIIGKLSLTKSELPALIQALRISVGAGGSLGGRGTTPYRPPSGGGGGAGPDTTL